MVKNKRKMSVISEFMIFLVFVLLSIILLNKNQNITNNISSNSYEEIENENKTYIKSIKDNYGINIVSGEESENLCINIDANAQYNINVINTDLKIILSELQKYPTGVYDIFKSKKYPLKIVIIDSFNNNNIALTSKSTLNEFKIYLSNTKKIEKALHHEMYHVLEYYMSDTNKYLFKAWYKLNPEDFIYTSKVEDIDSKYVFINLKEASNEDNVNYIYDDNPYFVTMYSKSTEREDRAEIFSELMIQTSKPDYLSNGQHILDKALYIDEVIKKCITNDDFFYSKYI